MFGSQSKKVKVSTATHAIEDVDTQQLVKAITQAMSCMYVDTKKLASDQETKGKPFLGTSRPSELSKGLDGSLDPNLSCQYCKDISHEKENCRQLQKNWLMTIWWHKNRRPREMTITISYEPD